VISGAGRAGLGGKTRELFDGRSMGLVLDISILLLGSAFGIGVIGGVE